jgi:iron complex transport system substrate-binding protein
MMSHKLYSLIILFCYALLISCNSEKEHSTENRPVVEIKTSSEVKYAKRFSVAKINGYTALYLFGNRKTKDTTAIFILYPGSEKKPNLVKNAFYIATPVDRVAAMGTVYVSMLQKLGLLDKIVAVENVDYYNNEFIINGVKQGKIKELSKGPQINVEQTLVLKPDLIITFGMGNPKMDMSDKILAAGIPAAISLDHLEETPLARAEWIKFVAAFFNKEQLADSIFKVTELNYNRLKTSCDSIKAKPTVFTDIKYGDAWYVPGGDSYISNIITDAGGQYIWKDEKKTGSIPLNFETVFAKAKDADFWINLFMINSKKELLGYEPRYNLFKAYKTGNIYNNNKVSNANSYSIYWEEGICSPDEVLKDLIKIFHPEVLPEHTLKYYKKIE